MSSSVASRSIKTTKVEKPIHDFQGHAHTVASVAFSTDGQYVLTGSRDNTAKLWNVNDGTVVHTFQGHADYVTSVTVSPIGQHVLTGSWDRTAKIWNVKDGAVVHTFQGHTKSVTSVAFSPNGKYALTGSDDKTAKLWNINDGTVVHTFQGHASLVYCVAFSANGQYVLTGSFDMTAKLWNAKDGTVVHTFQGHTKYVTSVAFAPDGQHALTGSWDKTAKLWNVKDGTVVHTFQGHTNFVKSAVFSPNGQYALTGSYDKTAKLWNVKDGTAVCTFTGHTDWVHSVVFSPNGQYALTGSQDKTAKLWRLPESVVASASSPESASPSLLTTNSVPNPPQTNPPLMMDSDPSGASSLNDGNFIPTASVLEITSTNSMPTHSYNSINFALLDKLHQQGDQFLDIINNVTKIETRMHLVSQYPDELQSLLYERTQSLLEEKELKDIMRSREHYQFYAHLVCKLNGMMKACETINSGMVSQADMSFQDYVHGLMREGAWAALQQMDLGKALAGVIQWAKKQFASVPFTYAIGSFFQIACEFKSKRDQHLAIGRVAVISALADMQEHDRGGINGTVHWIGRYIVRAQAIELSSLESEKFGRMKKLWTKAMGESANTSAKEQGCKVADLVIGVIMNPTKNTDLYNILEGHTINQSSSLGEIIVAAALDVSIEDVQNLELFSAQENNTDAAGNSASNVPTQQYSNGVGSSNAGGVISVADTNTSEQTNISSNADGTSKEEFNTMKKEVEMLRKEVAKLKKGNSETEVDSDNGLAQAYVNPHETGDQEISATRRIDYVEKRLSVMQSNLLEANKTIVELDERLESFKNNNRKKGIANEDQHGVSRRAKDKQRLAKEEEKRIRGELFNEK